MCEILCYKIGMLQHISMAALTLLLLTARRCYWYLWVDHKFGIDLRW